MALKKKKHKQSIREPNGRLQRRPEKPWTPEIIARRAELVGKENALDPRSGQALGVLLQRQIITQRQYDAGIAFEMFHRSWRAMAGARSPWEMPKGVAVEVDPAKWEKADRRMEDIVIMINALPMRELVKAALETIIIDNFLPPILEAELKRTLHKDPSAVGDHRGIKALRDALDVFAGFFN